MIKEIINSNLFATKFTKDLGWLILSNLLLGIAGILINLIIADKYGSDGLGIYSIGLKIYLIASLVASVGAGASVLKYVAQYKNDSEKMDKSITSGFALTLISSFFILTAGLLFSGKLAELFHSKELSGMLVIFFVSMPFFSLNKLVSGYLNGMRRIKLLSALQLLRWIIILIFTAIVVLSEKNALVYTSYAYLVSEIVLLIPGIFLIYKHLHISNIDKHWFSEHFSFGFKSMLSTAIIDLYNYLDIFVIAFFMNNTMVGLYTFASDIAKNLLLLSTLIQTNFSPIMTELFTAGKKVALNEKIKQLKNITFLIHMPIIILAIAAYYIFIRYYITIDLTDSLLPFIILSVGAFILSGYKPFAGILESTGYPLQRLWINIFTLIANFFLNIILIYFWGINGVAIATTLTYIMFVVLLDIYSKKYIGLKII